MTFAPLPVPTASTQRIPPSRISPCAPRGPPDSAKSFYLSERTDPGSDAERTFVQIFGVDLERDGAMSGLYLPLKDEEGIVGILLFEASRADFASTRQRELAAILANQATVAVRNARLYHQVPLADAIGALSAKREAFFEMPARGARWSTRRCR